MDGSEAALCTAASCNYLTEGGADAANREKEKEREREREREKKKKEKKKEKNI